MNNKKIKIRLNSIEDVKRFANFATNFKSEVEVITENVTIDGKSVLALLGLNLLQDVFVRILSDSTDECELFEKGMEDFEK